MPGAERPPAAAGGQLDETGLVQVSDEGDDAAWQRQDTEVGDRFLLTGGAGGVAEAEHVADVADVGDVEVGRGGWGGSIKHGGTPGEEVDL